MKRGFLLVLAIASCLLGASCARLQHVVGIPSTSRSPDPATAIAVSVLSDSIYLVDPDTGQQTIVAQGLVDFQAGYAAWAPDHRRLAYGSGGVTVLDLGRKRAAQVNRGQSLSMPAWSPSGKAVAYGDGLALWTAAADGSDPLRLRLPEAMAPLGMAWRPGRTIAFQGLVLDCNQPGPCASTSESDIWTIRPDGSGLHQVTTLGRCDSPKWSPDGKQLLFVRHRTVKKVERNEVWTIKPDGSGLRRLVAVSGVLGADWSPDGTRIAMVRSGGTAPAQTIEVWIADGNGAGLHRVGGQLKGSDASIDW
jgi:Tol biopolymer transport system component